jgi:predicted hotdog family 3-hydroxylacyl-ACP dehydratase
MTFPIQNAAEFIPQKHPFVLVDELLYADETTSLCSYLIPQNNVFVKDGVYTSSGMVESMAQTAAAGTGYLYKKENKSVPIGYIGSVQKLEVLDWPPIHSRITMEIKLLTNILQVSLVSASVKWSERIMAHCEMKIFISNKS